MSFEPLTRIAILLVWMSLSLCVGWAEAADHRLHVVSPDSVDTEDLVGDVFTSPEAAVDALAEVAEGSPAADVEVRFHQGTHRIAQPLQITPAEVPRRGRLTLAAADSASVVISGGRRIVDWTVHPDGTWSTDLSTTFSEVPTVRELFVGGQRRPRARHPNTGFARIERAFEDQRSGFTFPAGSLPTAWTGGGELVFLHDWSTSRIPVAEVDHQTNRLTVAFPIGNRADHYKIDHFEPHPRFFVEGHREFFDAAGEWWLEDHGRLHYWPLPDESPETAEVIAPVADGLLIVTGNDSSSIANVHVAGLSFEHCRWDIPRQGFAASQATAYERRGPADETTAGSRSFVPAAIRFENAVDCSFTGGRIAHLGTSGIEFGSRTRRCRLQDTVLEDIAGNGVNLGEDSSRLVDGQRWWQSAPEQIATGHEVRHNRIVRCGQLFYGAVAIWGGLVHNVRISNNEIAHHPYTGVSLGWMWNPTPTPAGHNVVSENHIHHVMQILSDGGGIYTLGRQPETRLVANVIHDLPINLGRAESNGMFIDEGSDQIEIRDNVIYAVQRSPLRFHRTERLRVESNTLVVPDANTPPLRFNNAAPEKIVQTNNRVLEPTEFDAQSVVRPDTGPR